MITLKLMVNKRLRYIKKENMLDSKTWEENEIIIFDLCRFWKHFSARR